MTIGTHTQLQWLRAGDPELNWTLPAPHQFNAVGWYHAAFLIAASPFFAGLWVAVLCRFAQASALLAADNHTATAGSQATV